MTDQVQIALSTIPTQHPNRDNLCSMVTNALEDSTKKVIIVRSPQDITVRVELPDGTWSKRTAMWS